MPNTWATSVQARMRALGISNRALATACDKSESTIRRWLSGADEPRGSDIVKIAERLNEDPLTAFIRLGWLPGAASEALKLRMVDQRIRQAILRQVQVDTEPRTPLGAFVDKVSSEPGWAAITSHVARGAVHQVQFEDHIELVPTRRLGYEPTRAEVNTFLDPLMSVHDAAWCDDPGPTLGGWSDGVIKVPRVLAARPPGERTLTESPPSIVIIGTWLTGNAKIGSLLATTLGYGYVGLATAARLALGVRADTWDRQVDRLEIARTLFTDPEGLGRQVVWAMDMADAVELLTSELAGGDTRRRPFIINCRPNDPLLGAELQANTDPQGPSKAELVGMRSEMDDLLATLQDRVVTVNAKKAIGRGDMADQYWDEHVRTFTGLLDAIGTEWGLADTKSLVGDAVERWQ